MPIDYGVATDEFDAHWKNRDYPAALAVYFGSARPFWLADRVGRYFERKGLMNKAMVEYQHLVNSYFEIRPDFLPLPTGPAELFKLGRFYADKDQIRAREYLSLYLSAQDVWKNDPALHLSHKTEALKILRRLEGRQ